MTHPRENDAPEGRKRRILGICNYCGAPKPIFEQEDEYRVLFRACLDCLADIVKGYRPPDPNEPSE